jgi:arginine decarboxylase
MGARQSETPYLDALRDYALREPARLHVPGHKGGPGADPGLIEAIGERALALDIPALTYGVDLGPAPTPFAQAQQLAAEAWGAKRTWFLVNGASQGNIAAGLALAHHGREVVLQRNVHSSTIDALVLSGLRPTFVAPELDPELGIAHCLSVQSLADSLAVTPAAAGAWVVSPTYFGAVADIRALADVAHARELPLIVDEAWGAHLAFHEQLPEHALAAGADLVISSTHKIVGSLTQSAMLHLGSASGALIDEDAVDRAVTLTESTSPSALLTGSLDAARRQAAMHGRELLANTIPLLARTREEIRAIEGLDVLDERLVGRAGVFAYDPLRLAVDVRGVAASGYELAPLLRELGDINLELYGENVIVAVFGMAERGLPDASRFVRALQAAVATVGPDPSGGRAEFAAPPPWGELAMTPREAYFGPQEVVAAPAAPGRIAAESLATYPPGIPNVLPGERLSADTLAYIQHTLEQGGSVRGRATGCCAACASWPSAPDRGCSCFSFRSGMLARCYFESKEPVMAQVETHPRIAPLEPPYEEDTARMLARWMPPGAEVEPLRLFRTLAVHPELAARMRPLGAAILAHGAVPARLREVMIERTCALCGAEYEWGVHATAFAAGVGLSDEQLASTAAGGEADAVWSDDERAVLRLADELHRDGQVSDELFALLERHLSAPQILELTVTAGWYHTISYVINVARVQLEPWAARFPV